MALESLCASWATQEQGLQGPQMSLALKSAIAIDDFQAISAIVGRRGNPSAEITKIVLDSEHLEATALWILRASEEELSAFLQTGKEKFLISLVRDGAKLTKSICDTLWKRNSNALRREVLIYQSRSIDIPIRRVRWLLNWAEKPGFFSKEESKEEYFFRLGSACDHLYNGVLFDLANEGVRCFMTVPDEAGGRMRQGLQRKLLSHFADKQKVEPLDALSVSRFVSYLGEPILKSKRRHKDAEYETMALHILNHIKLNPPSDISDEEAEALDSLLSHAGSSAQMSLEDNSLSATEAEKALKKLRSNSKLTNEPYALEVLLQERAKSMEDRRGYRSRGWGTVDRVLLGSQAVISAETGQAYWKKVAAHPQLSVANALGMLDLAKLVTKDDSSRDLLISNLFKGRNEEWIKDFSLEVLNEAIKSHTKRYSSHGAPAKLTSTMALSTLSEEARVAFYQEQVESLADFTTLAQVMPDLPLEVMHKVKVSWLAGTPSEAASKMIYKAAAHYLGDDAASWENFEKLSPAFSGSILELIKVSAILSE